MTVFDAIGSTGRRCLYHDGRDTGPGPGRPARVALGPSCYDIDCCRRVESRSAAICKCGSFLASKEQRARIRCATGLRAVGIARSVTQSKPAVARLVRAGPVRRSTGPIYIGAPTDRTRSRSRRREQPTGVRPSCRPSVRPIRRLYRRDARKLLMSKRAPDAEPFGRDLPSRRLIGRLSADRTIQHHTVQA